MMYMYTNIWYMFLIFNILLADNVQLHVKHTV